MVRDSLAIRAITAAVMVSCFSVPVAAQARAPRAGTIEIAPALRSG
jgi:hypothetical protein